MKIETILNGRKVRSLFDSGCNEFERLSLDDKLRILASLSYYGLLEKALQKFINHSTNTDRWNEKELLFTLKYYLKELTTNKFPLSTYRETIAELENQLTKFTDSNYSLRNLLISYLEDDQERLSKENQFFKIDFDRELSKELTKRDKIENKTKEESYTRLEILKNLLISDYKNNNFRDYPIDNGMDYQTEYIVKHYLKKPDKENYLNALEYIFRILYLEKEPYHPFFLFRVNFEEVVVKDFKEKSQVAIRFDKNEDFEDWKKAEENGKPKQQYVQRWVQLYNAVKENDVIVIASYQKLGYKIGIIPKNAGFQKNEMDDNSFYIVFDLKDANEIDLRFHPYVHTLLPSNVTISRIKRKNIKLRKLSHNMNVNLSHSDFDDIAFEILVAEWLRTQYAPEEYRILFQFLKTGGSKSDMDIFAMTYSQEKLVVQVSNTNDSKLINKKINKLKDYSECKKLFFFNIPDQKRGDYEIINLEKVVSDLKRDERYNELIEELE